MKIKKILAGNVRDLFKFFGFNISRVYPEPKTPRSVTWFRQFAYFGRMFDNIADVPGDIVECGIGNGRTFLMLGYHTISEKSPLAGTRNLWGFDSFKGFPKPGTEDISARDPQEGDWSNASADETLKRMRESGIIPADFIKDRLKLTPGFFSESLKEFPDRKIAFLHIDADIYQSYLDVLNLLYSKVSKGGVILFDEYNSKKWPGATKAIDEFFAGKGEVKRDSLSGKYYVIKS